MRSIIGRRAPGGGYNNNGSPKSNAQRPMSEQRGQDCESRKLDQAIRFLGVHVFPVEGIAVAQYSGVDCAVRDGLRKSPMSNVQGPTSKVQGPRSNVRCRRSKIPCRRSKVEGPRSKVQRRSRRKARVEGLATFFRRCRGHLRPAFQRERRWTLDVGPWTLEIVVGPSGQMVC